MDFFSSHWGTCRRQLPSRFQIQTVGYLPRKTNRLRCSFTSCNFSFILSGGGDYRRNGIVSKVEPPCVITQWPGEFLEYGPASAHNSWEELYLVYRAETKSHFEECGFVHPSRPMWIISQWQSWREAFQDLLQLARDPNDAAADRFDRLCERLIMESLLRAPSREGTSGESPLIGQLRSQVGKNLKDRFDFQTAARRLGMSQSTFRRRWMRDVGAPPAHYLGELKMREARRRLVETNLTVGEISALLGYDDPLYFSRKFRKAVGCSATQYRKTYQGQIPR